MRPLLRLPRAPCKKVVGHSFIDIFRQLSGRLSREEDTFSTGGTGNRPDWSAFWGTRAGGAGARWAGTGPIYGERGWKLCLVRRERRA